MTKRLTVLLLLTVLAMGVGASTYNVRDFGAKGDGLTLDHAAINQAIEKACNNGGGRVVLPAGTYLCGSIRLKSNVELHLMAGARILAAPAAMKAYDKSEVFGGPEYQDGGHTYFHNSLIWAEGQQNISITGRGMIDGEGLTKHDTEKAGNVQGGSIGTGDKAIALKLPNTITDLGYSTFTSCNHLASINMPDSLKSIKLYTFQYCKALTSVALPPGLTSISNYAFNGCEHLVSVSFPSTLRIIGQEAFRDCHELDSVILPEGFRQLGLDAFRDCKSITYISIPASVNSFSAFEGCNAITSVNISSRHVNRFGQKVAKLVLGEGVQYIGGRAFEDCTQLGAVEFPSTVAVIGACAFRNCSLLTSIVLPERLLVVHDRAFYGCRNLKSVTCLAPTPPSFSDVSDYPVFDPQTLDSGTLYVPSDLVETYKSTNGWRDFKNIVGI